MKRMHLAEMGLALATAIHPALAQLSIETLSR